jgi:hypothetical protein
MNNRRRGGLTARRVQQQLLQAEAIKLRVSGVSFPMIAERLGYSNSGSAYKAVERGLQNALRERGSEELRELELQRLDLLLLALWPRAMSGDRNWLVVDRILQIIDMRCRLLGLYAPNRQLIEVVTPDALSTAIAEMEAQLANNNSTKALPAGADR